MNEFSIDAACAGYDELYHHGIPNQRWGVRNGPPYPLDQKRHRRVVSGKQDKEIKKYDKKKHGISHLSGASRGWRSVENFNEIKRNFSKDGKTFTRTYGSSEGLKNIAEIIGRGGDDELAWRTLDRPGHKATSEDLLKVNQQRFYQGPNAHQDGALDPGLRNNCGMCSVAMFLRGQGYDIQAGRTDSGVLNTAEEYWFDGAKSYKTKGAQALYQQLQSFGNQGKGVLSVRHKNGSGHAVYFQMEKQSDGRLRPSIYDGQIAKKYDSLSDFLREEHADMTQFAKVTRLDGTTPNWKHLAEDGAIRANVDRIWSPSGEDRLKGNITDAFVQNTRTGKSYNTFNFTYAGSKAFQRDNAEMLNMAKNGQYWVNDSTGSLWATSGAYEQSKARAQSEALAREELKRKYGIGV